MPIAAVIRIKDLGNVRSDGVTASIAIGMPVLEWSKGQRGYNWTPACAGVK